MRSTILLVLLSCSAPVFAASAVDTPARVQATGNPDGRQVEVTWDIENLSDGANFYLVKARPVVTGNLPARVLVPRGSRTASLTLEHEAPGECPDDGFTECPDVLLARAAEYRYTVCARDGELDLFEKCAEEVELNQGLPVPSIEMMTVHATERRTINGRPFVWVRWTGARDADVVTVRLSGGRPSDFDPTSGEAFYPLWQPAEEAVPAAVRSSLSICARRFEPEAERCESRMLTFMNLNIGPDFGQLELAPATAPTVRLFSSRSWNSVSFEWTPASSLAKYAVYRKAFGFGFVEVAQPTGTGFFAEGGLTPNSVVEYAVCRLNSFGSRCTHFDVELPPAPPPRPLPLGVTLSGPLQTTITVDYVVPETAQDPVSFVELTLAGAPGELRTNTQARGRLSISGLTPGGTYRADVRAKNVSGFGPVRSLVVQLPSPLPATPSAPRAGAISASQVKLVWANPVPALVAAQKLRIERLVLGSWFTTGVVSASTTTFIEGSLPPGTAQTYRLCAINGYGTVCGAPDSATTKALDPDAPVPLKSVDHVGFVDLRWSSRFAAFEVQRFVGGTWRAVATTSQHQLVVPAITNEVWNWRVCELVTGRRACSVDAIARAQ